jgi:ABC-type multidrug transport system ATPase subunit
MLRGHTGASLELAISHLSKTYANGTRALQDITLTIPAGMFGLLGPNGAGKSTLMRTLATLQDADSGSARLGEIDVLKDKEAVRRVLGYLPQDFGVYPKVSAEDLLEHFARLKGIANRGERKALVKALLQQVNLYDVRHKALGGFSGGMKQRFGIAQALIGDPKLVIVDEPTAGLDPQERVRFLNLLSEIGEQVVVILSTHIVADVADLCQRMAIVCGGKVLLSGEPQALIRSVQGRIWRKVIDKAELADHQQRFAIISSRLSLGRTVVHAFAESAPDASFEPVPPDLEDVYFAAIGGHLNPSGPAPLAEVG